ncbi:MAG: putative outer membrane protein [Rhodocyclaceae bacterium]|nr:MAG: putative outer membrane protein [Rhodocyclaceae bacterium]TND00253.1 MAG: putative outer membrane protein [Rhodocyclaceae bacterium]
MLKKYILAGIALVSFSVGALADSKIGFVNSQKILNDAPQAARAKKKIEKDFEKRDQDLQRIAKQLQGLQENLDKNAVTMAESDRRTKEREFADLNREFQRKQREFREDLSQRQNEEMAAIFERVNKIIKQIAEAEKYDIIFQEAVYANPRIDITERVIKALGDGTK